MAKSKVTYFRKTTDHLEKGKIICNNCGYFMGIQVLKDDYKINGITYFTTTFLFIMFAIEGYVIYGFSSSSEKMLETMANVGFIFQVILLLQ